MNKPVEMSCSYCPKRKLCSGAACYYEDHPEKIPSRELLEDKELLEAAEASRITLGAPNIRWEDRN